MNQELANKLNEEGAIILILDMQRGAEIGLDYNSWLVGENFLGFKMVSPGFHCIFFSSVSKEHEFSPRTIIPLFLQSKEVRVFQYDSKEEQIVNEDSIDPEIVSKYKKAGSEFYYDRQTAAYPFDTMAKWMNMTNYVTKELYDQLTDRESISFILDANSEHKYHYSSTVNITELIQTRSNPQVLSLLSKLYVDTTDEVIKLVNSYPSKFKYPSLHGEFQFAFIMFHIGQDYESLLQWKNLLFLITGAYSLITDKQTISVNSFYEAVLKTLYLQLSELEDDFFTLANSSSEEMTEGIATQKATTNRKNFVIRCLESMNDIIEEEPEAVLSVVKKQMISIKNLLKKRFHIKIQRTTDGPTIVN